MQKKFAEYIQLIPVHPPRGRSSEKKLRYSPEESNEVSESKEGVEQDNEQIESRKQSQYGKSVQQSTESAKQSTLNKPRRLNGYEENIGNGNEEYGENLKKAAIKKNGSSEKREKSTERKASPKGPQEGESEKEIDEGEAEDGKELKIVQPYDKRARAAALRRKHRTL
ncbi:hypothetical protein Tcan_06084 [Toxocara canis]|uniref:Uncharacterized protein n=1 Tax=Toxocara canis TaxID=6265 RepID=A0A0B2VHK0_TOXCA|nr:hypothetical protein Tcan_06084 [Toxocara canis]